MPLNDKEIRPNFINFLNTCSNKPNKVIEELPVSYGSAIADVVGIYNTLHCYEIKGETDTVQRIQKQGEFYNKSFPLITLVTPSEISETILGNLISSAEKFILRILVIKESNLSIGYSNLLSIISIMLNIICILI